MTYKFKYKRFLFWKTLKNVTGHNYNEVTDKMDVFFEDKIISIPEWSKCSLYLGQDFIFKEKQSIKEVAGN